MMYFLLKTGSSTRAISTCRTPRRVKLDGHKAMLGSFGVTFTVDKVTRNLEMAAMLKVL